MQQQRAERGSYLDPTCDVTDMNSAIVKDVMS